MPSPAGLSSSENSTKVPSTTKCREEKQRSSLELGTLYFVIIIGRELSTEKEVRDAYKRLQLLNHPDNGGSTYLSTKINEAKDILVKSSSDAR